MNRIAITILAALGACGGCNYIAYLLAPPLPAKRVPAEYSGLAGKKLLILVYAPETIHYDYPLAEAQVAANVAQSLGKHTKAKIIPIGEVLNYQETNLHWRQLPLKEIARHFAAEQVLYIELQVYRGHDPLSANLLRGRIQADCSLHEFADKDKQRMVIVWRNTVAATFPAKQPVSIYDASEPAVLQQTLSIFAENLARKFYKHKVRQEQ